MRSVRRLASMTWLDWRGVPIILGRGKTRRITYDPLWIHVASQSVACIRWNRWNV